MVSLDLPSLGHTLERSDCWLKFLIYFRVVSNQAFLAYSSNLVTYIKFLGSVMKCDTSYPEYPKLDN